MAIFYCFTGWSDDFKDLDFCEPLDSAADSVGRKGYQSSTALAHE